MRQRVQNEFPGVRPVEHAFPGELRLWIVDLDAWSDALPDAALAESGPRPARTPLSRETRRRLAARKAARSLLAAQLGRPPHTLQFRVGALGKPHLAGRELRFSLSRSGPLGLLGISRELEVGVDLETVRAVPELHGLAAHHLTESETSEWRAAEPGDLSRRFLEVWTRKEACAKALGVGLLIPPVQIAVGRSPDPRPVEIAIPGSVCRVTVCPVPVTDRAVAAVALASADSAGAAVRAYGHAGGQGAGSGSSSRSVFR